MEDCSVKRIKRYKNGFQIYFVNGNYYFLLEFCPCGCNTKYQCRKLSGKINNWLKNNKNCAQQRV
jgi:hypothetical protein